MKKRQYAITGLAAALLATATACTADLYPDGKQAAQGVAVTLSVDMAAAPMAASSATRAAQNVYTETTFQQGDGIYCYFPDQGVFTIPHAVYTCQAPNGTVNTCTPDQQCYMKSQTEKPMYAYYPSQVNESTASFSVQQDQSTDKNYRLSDLMYGTGNVEATTGRCVNAAVNGSSDDALTLQHQMARLQITATDKSGAGITAIRIITGYRTVALTRNTGAMTLGALSDAITPQSYVTAWSGTATAKDGTVECAVLLPPQPIAAGIDLLSVETSKGEIIYSVNQARQLASGNSYTLAFDVTHTTTTASIATWTDGGAPATQESDEDLYTVNGVTFRMIPVGAGMATCNIGTITYPYIESSDFYMAETECTEQLWSAVYSGTLQTATSTTSPAMVGVSKNMIDITANTNFIAKLNALTETQRPAGWEFALPTINQWQYAACGGSYSHGFTYAGTNNASDVVTGSRTYPKTKMPNELGLYDMSSNVKEILLETSGGTTTGNMRSACGKWDSAQPNTSIEYSNHNVGTSYNDWGFRIALVQKSASASFTGTTTADFNSSTAVNPTLKLTSAPAATQGNPFTVTRPDGVIDLNGQSITGNYFLMQNRDPNKTLTIKNGTLVGIDGQANWGTYPGTVVLQDLTVTGTVFTDGHKIIIKSGTYNQVYNQQPATAQHTQPDIIISGGTFTKLCSHNAGNDTGSIGGNYTILGGNFDTITSGVDGEEAAYPPGGTYTIYGGNFKTDPSTLSFVTIAPGYRVVNTGSGEYPYQVQVTP